MEVWFKSKLRNLWLSYNYSIFSSILLLFGFNISYSSGDWQSSRLNSMGTIADLFFHLSFCTARSVIWDHLNVRCSVDWTTVFNNSFFFMAFVRPVISRQKEQLFSIIGWHDSSAVSNIGNVTFVTYHKDYNSTRAWSVVWRFFLISVIKESSFSF